MNRTLATTIICLLVPLVWAAMWLGWRHRARRQAAFPAPRRPEEVSLEPASVMFEGTYVSTTRHGDWLDRVVVHGLGTRSEARVSVGSGGVVVERVGAEGFGVPREDLLGASTAAGIAGKVVESGGLALVTWRLGDEDVDTGVRLRHADDTGRLVDAVNALVGRVEA